ncbi:uncharacterized protein LOC124149448 [Haliotis rufescens]|uniref:uncharacterized protein LOC124149448 n=1 Tax=Haliotis rufescens TaxID=6454 RepID=UPI00201EB526|nr:uncharacterized protein LOC124149448 [Haliotis rufescens]
MASSSELTSVSLAPVEDDLAELIVSEGIPVRANSDDVPKAITLVKTQNIYTGPTPAGTVGDATLDLQIDDAEEIFVATESFRIVEQKLKDFGHVTICGASGEGKTTAALMLGSQYRKMGYKLAFVDIIERFDLDSFLSSSPRVFLIIDDMFGTVGLSTDVSQLKIFLNKLARHLKHCKRRAEKQGAPRKQQVKKGQESTKKIRVVFTTKTYNFHDGVAQLQYEGFSLFKGPTLVDLTTQEKHRYTQAEKKAIFEHHRDIHREYSDEDCEDIPDFELWHIDSSIFGFPLTCKLSFDFSSIFKNKNKFFKEPLLYLRLELKNLLRSKTDRSAVLVLMLLCDDKLDLAKLEANGKDKKLDHMVSTVLDLLPSASRQGMYEAAKCLRGTFLTRGDAVGFAHSSIYDACACSLFEISPTFVLTHCSDNFIYERVQPQPVEESKIDDHLHLIYLSEVYYDILTTRLAESVKNGQFSKSVTHPILRQEKVALQLLEKLHDGSMDECWFHKRDKGNCFLYWAVLGHSAKFVLEIEHETGGEFTQTEISEAMEGCVVINNLTVLKWLFPRSNNPNIDLTMNLWMLQAAEHGSSETLVYLIENGADVFTIDAEKRNIIHIACTKGHKKTLKVLKEHNSEYFKDEVKKVLLNSTNDTGMTPLMVAALTGSYECYQLLQSISNKNTKDKNGNDIMDLACQGGNKAIVKHLVSPSNINTRGKNGSTPVMMAAFWGHQSVFDLLVSEQADLTLVDNDGDSLLHFACKGGNEAIVQHLVSPSNINTRGLSGYTPVMMAAFGGHQSVFDLLVSEQADLTLVDDGGESLLHFACQGGNKAIVQHLVSPSNINTRGLSGYTPVMMAAFGGHQSVFDLLVSEQADLTLVDDGGESLLHFACHGGNEAIVQHLVSSSDINTRGLDGCTPVMLAAFWGHQSVFDLLVSKQADLTLVNNYGNSLLHVACRGGNKAIVQHLVSSSNINTRGRNGYTPVMMAAFGGHQSVFDLLVSEQADLTLVDDGGESLLHFACQGGNKAIVQHLVSPSNINTRGLSGYTPVMMAAFGGHQSVFDLLVSEQADLTLVDDGGESLLHFACHGGNEAIVQHLVSSSDINTRGLDGCTPVMLAAFWGHQSVFDLLVSKQADLTLVNNYGNSLLHVACRGGNKAIVQHLVSSSNINTRGRNGYTPVMVAAVFGHQSVFDVLVSEQADLTLLNNHGESLLHVACRGGNKAIVQHLVSPSNINTRGRNADTPVMVAAGKGHQNLFDLLVSKQADLTLVNNDGDSLLHVACQGGNKAIVQHLVSSSNINTRGRNGYTPVMVAAVFGHQSAFDVLVLEQADLTLLNNHGDSLLHVACQGGNKAIVQHLVSPSNINTRGRDGYTPVMVAADKGHQNVFDLLVSKQADLTLVNNDGDSLLYVACWGGNKAIVQHLVSPSNINTRGRNAYTPVMMAAFRGHQSVFDLLVSKQADLTLVNNDGESLLHVACCGGNKAIVQHLVSPSNINTRGRNAYTPVMMAAFRGHQSVFDLLVSKQADLTLVNNDGDSLLHVACQGGNKAIVQHLVSSSNINTRGQNGYTPVMMAAFGGHQSVFDLLVSKQADLTLVDSAGDSLLHVACLGGNKAIVQHLVSSSNINTRGQNGYTPVMMAAFRGHQSVFDLLVSKQADLTLVNNDGESLLHVACCGGNKAIVQHLVSPSNINTRGRNAYTPVMMAAFRGHQSVFDLLVSKQADLTLVNNDGDSLLHVACQGGNKAIVQHLVSSSNINTRGQNGYTPVMVAAFWGHQSVFDLLVSKQADLTLVDNDGDSLLHFACQGGNEAIVQHLVSSSDINTRRLNGVTPVMMAAFWGHQSVFDLLVSEQADLTLLDNNGDSLLHFACKGGNKAIVQHLVSPSNINTRGRNGYTPVMVAAGKGHESVFDLLVSKQADLTLVNNDGDSLLHVACWGGNKAIVQHLVSPSNINTRGRNAYTTVMMAAFRGHQSVFDLLVSKQADLTLVNNDGDSLLHVACWGGNKAIVQHLVSSSNINTRGQNGYTSVMMAAFRGHQSVFDLLVSKQADLTLVNNDGDSLLHVACWGGNKAIVQHLVSPSNINTRGRNACTTVIIAAFRGHQSVFDLLVSKQADLTLVNNDGDSLLHVASRGGNKAIVQHLVSPSNINTRGKNGYTPVMVAAGKGHESVFDLLVSKQADLTLVNNDGESLLHVACCGGNKAIVQHLVSPSNINTRGRNAYTPVMMAAFRGHQSVFDLLVSKQADLTLVNNDGDSLLHVACQGGNKAIVQHLVSSSNINTRGQNGYTPVMMAAFGGHQSVFDLLVSKQADLTLVDSAGDSLLHVACLGGNKAIVQHLVSSSNINTRGQNGYTPVMMAAFRGHQSVFDLLVSKQADLTLVNNDGESLLHVACCGGNKAIVQHLVSPSNINTRGRNAYTPVMMAAFRGHQSVFDLLVSKQADLTLVNNDGDSLLHVACQGGNKAIVQHLVSSSNINTRGQNGYTPVMVAAFWGHQSVFDLLVSKQADLTLVDNDGDSLLHFACQGGNEAIVQHLVSSSDINTRRLNGVTPVMMAAFWGHQSVFDLLVSEQADLTLLDNNGDSLLHFACKGGNKAIVQHLVSPSNINTRGRNGYTPVMVAAGKGHESVFDLLVSKQADLTLVNNDGDSLLHVACWGGNKAIVQHLVSPSNINTRGRNAYTTVMMAAFRGHQSVFDLLVSKQADLTLVNNDGDSLLHVACWGGNKAIVQHLVSSSNINTRGQNGYTSVMMAAFRGHQSVFDLLVSKQADLTLVNNDGDSLLHVACWGGNKAIVQHLVSPSNINTRGRNACTTVIIAAFRGHQSVFDLLVSKQADLTLVNNDGDSLLHVASRGGNKAIVQHLVSPSNINTRGKNGYTPVMVAAGKGHESVFDLLVSKQADLTLVDNDSDSLLHVACRGGNKAIVQHLVSPSNINTRGRNGYTPVMVAAGKGHQSVFDLLVSKQADLTLVDNDGDSLLHVACRGGNKAIVQHLVSPSNINTRGRNGYTPVIVAAGKGHERVFDLLVSKQADLTLVNNDGDSLLHVACCGGNKAIVQHLVSSSNINTRGRNGYTPVMVAAVFGHQSAFDVLVSEQADLTLLNNHGDSLLYVACWGGNKAIVQHLVSPSNINTRGRNDYTPVMVAAFRGHRSVFDLLVSKQADLTLVNNDGDSLLHVASRGGNKAIVQHLVSPSNINTRGRNGYTPVMMAAFRGHQSVFDLLVSKQADLTLVNNDGDSLLHVASRCGNKAIVQHLVSSSNINTRGQNGYTSVMMAAFRGHQSVFDLLVSKQADLTLVNNDGDSLLHVACWGGNKAIVQHLVSSSNINTRGQNGYTSVMMAAFRGHQSVFDLLVSKQADLTLVDNYGNSLLHVACQGGNKAIVQHLVSSSSNINTR